MLQTVLGIFVFAGVHAASEDEVLMHIEDNSDQELMFLLTSDPLDPAVKRAAARHRNKNLRSDQAISSQETTIYNPHHSNFPPSISNNRIIDNLIVEANRGDVEAAYTLGDMYFYGKGIRKNYQRAFKYFSISAGYNDSRSLNQLGLMYYNGNGVEKNDAKALNNFKKAAGLGNKMALSNVALCYLYGKGVKPNIQKAINIYNQLTNQGYADAPFHLAMLYMDGKYVGQDMQKAYDFMKQALDLKSAKAQNYINENPDFLFDRGQTDNNFSSDGMSSPSPEAAFSDIDSSESVSLEPVSSQAALSEPALSENERFSQFQRTEWMYG
ncbi:MAG: hypothetical protein HEEMFOPI_00993 [Holosporales bacterium]